MAESFGSRSTGAYLIGDWARVQQWFDELPPRLHLAINYVLWDEAHELVRRIQHGIKDRTYNTRFNWPALARYTVERKAVSGADPRTLIEWGDFLNHVAVHELAPGVLAVGIQDRFLAGIAEKHEYGDPTTKLPARPFWRWEYDQYKRRLRRRVQAAVAHGMRTR